jgi:outer membrane receptor protein involved in Fe transport
VIVQTPVPNPMMPAETLLQFQNIGQYITQGIEAEASYRTASGWYGFLGAMIAKVGLSEDPAAPVTYGDTPDAAPYTGTLGLSTPKLGGYLHVSSELYLIGPRPNRVAIDGSANEDSPAWVGWNIALYAPSIHGFDVSLVARNLGGKRDKLPAPGDYDRTSPNEVVIPRIPGESRELYLKVGYAY